MHESPNKQRRFSYDDVFAGMCMMEEIVESNMPEASHPWQAYREAHGTMALRDAVIEKLIKPCNARWERTQNEMAEAIKNAPTREAAMVVPDPGSFDYEFVPFWLRECVDWSDISNGPRVRGA
ncbi:MAG: hypothetical protein K2X36_00570 [Microbacteriaceae bacterium]|nr:hypothetical protein [Microbacteriaceae bacterium]